MIKSKVIFILLLLTANIFAQTVSKNKVLKTNKSGVPINNTIVKGFLEPGDKIKLPGGNVIATILDLNNDTKADSLDFNDDEDPEAYIIITNNPRVIGIDLNKDNKPDYYFYYGVNRRIYLSKTEEINPQKLQELNIKKISKWIIAIGDIIQLPGGNTSGTIIDSNSDNVADAIDFNNDGKGDLNIIATENPRAIGIDQNKDTKPEYYLLANKKGEIMITMDAWGKSGNASSDKGKKVYKYNQLQLSLGWLYLQTPIKLSDGLLNGQGYKFSIEQGIDNLLIVKKITENKRRWWMPGIIMDISYLKYQQSLINIQGTQFTFGPNWILYLDRRYHWRFNYGFQYGLSFLKIKGSFFDLFSTTSNFALSTGMQYEFGKMGLFLNITAVTLTDATSPIYNYGLSTGFIYQL